MEDWFNFVCEVGDSFCDAYVPIVEKRKALLYTPEQKIGKKFVVGAMLNSIWFTIKGTLFGLKTNGRIESILMSLPPHVQWHYDHHPVEGSEEEKLIKVLESPIDWI